MVLASRPEWGLLRGTAGTQRCRTFSSTPPSPPARAGEHENRWRFCKSKEGKRGHFVKVGFARGFAAGGWQASAASSCLICEAVKAAAPYRVRCAASLAQICAPLM